MKLTHSLVLLFASLAVAPLALSACALDTSGGDAEATAASEDELMSLKTSLVGDFEWRAKDSGTFVDFKELSLHADGTYTARVDSMLVDPQVRCIAFPCALPEEGTWSVSRSHGAPKIRVRPEGHGSRSYFAHLDLDGDLSLRRYGETTTLFAKPDLTCANVRCAAGTHCEMKGINGGAVPVCIDDPAPCVRSGCSGEICADEPRFSTCIYRPENACYQAATCERQSDGACGFTETPELTSCLAAAAE